MEVLEKARELIKIGYVRGNWALNKEGKSVDPWSEEAVCFCGEGAIIGGCHFEENAQELEKAAITLFQAANKEFVGNPRLATKILSKKGTTTRIDPSSVVPLVNDDSRTTQKDMVRFFTNAIKLAKMARWG